MKKISIKLLCMVVLSLLVFTMVSCFNEDTTLEFVKFPDSAYKLGESGSGEIDLSKVEVKIGEETYTVKRAQDELGTSVSGYKFSEVGTYTLVIKYNSVTISYTYNVYSTAPVEVTHDVDWVGSGSEADPWQISSVDELQGLATVVNGKQAKTGVTDLTFAGKYFKLTNDLDLTNKIWSPIGEGNRNDTTPKYFAGTFDGDSHTIKGLSDIGYNPADIAATYESSRSTVNKGYVFGLFGIINGATIKKLKMTDVNINGISIVVGTSLVVYSGDSVGAIAGYAIIDGNHNTIQQCEVLSGQITGYDAVAGIVGRSYGGVGFYECVNKANLSVTLAGSNAKVGGITSIISFGTNEVYHVFYKCKNEGNITGGSNSANTGAIIGNLQCGTNKDRWIFIGCSNSGNIVTKGSENNYLIGYIYYSKVEHNNIFMNNTNSKGSLFNTNLLPSNPGISFTSFMSYYYDSTLKKTIEFTNEVVLETAGQWLTDFDWYNGDSTTALESINFTEITDLRPVLKTN